MLSSTAYHVHSAQLVPILLEFHIWLSGTVGYCRFLFSIDLHTVTTLNSSVPEHVFRPINERILTCTMRPLTDEETRIFFEKLTK